MLKNSVNLLNTLRDTDWRIEAGLAEQSSVENTENFEQVDTRLEATSVYMAPELTLFGNFPDFLSDSWSLGVVAYQLLLRRPPSWADCVIQGLSDEETAQHVVKFKYTEDERLMALPMDARVRFHSF